MSILLFSFRAHQCSTHSMISDYEIHVPKETIEISIVQNRRDSLLLILLELF